MEAAERVAAAVRDITDALNRAQASAPWAIVVGHGGTLRLALLTLFGIPLDRFWSFAFAPCAISVVQLAHGRASLVAHNLTDHLAPLATDPVAGSEARAEHEGAL
jgi:broad specificity phosphatase PhoE